MNRIKAIFYILLSLALVMASLQAAATAASASSGAAGAKLVGYGTDKDAYHRGDTAAGYITLKNTGDAVIDEVTISVSVARSVPLLGKLSLGSRDFKLSGLGIRPGQTKKAGFSVDIPKEYGGLSTAGNYELNGKVLVGGDQVGSFARQIKVV